MGKTLRIDFSVELEKSYKVAVEKLERTADYAGLVKTLQQSFIPVHQGSAAGEP